MKTTIALLIILLAASACSHHKESETLFLHADSLMEEHPDSALRLLTLLPEEIKEFSNKECARYALLLARATDKSQQSLLPCDSLLEVALDYYDDDKKERAVALLYKGRLLVEMEKEEEAISYLQDGLTIINNFPKEIKTKNLLLSSLGNIYFDAGYYDEAMKVYQAFYKCCVTDLDKSIALNDISSYYCLIDEKDSTLMIQRKALEYAIASGDSAMIAYSNHLLSLEFNDFDELDSALYYAQKAIKELPQNENFGNYYANLGDLLSQSEDNKELATHYLQKGLRDCPIKGKAGCLRNLYDLEKESGNYEAAILYLEEYSAIIDSLYTMEQSSEIQQLIHEYNTKMRVREEQLRGNRIIYLTTAGFVFACFLIILIYQNRINRKNRLQLLYKQSLEQKQNKLSSLQTTIENNRLIITLLHQEQSDLAQEKEKQIEEREHIIANLTEEKHRLLNWLLAQTDIYKKVLALSKQTVSDKKQMKALTNSEQGLLKTTVFEIYRDYTESLKTKHPKLTEDDLLFLCLQETSLTPQSIAFCFGYTDTHTLNQKKYRLKERMK